MTDPIGAKTITDMKLLVATCEQATIDARAAMLQAAADVIEANAHVGRLTVEKLEAGWERVRQAKLWYEPTLAAYRAVSGGLTRAREQLATMRGDRFGRLPRKTVYVAKPSVRG